MLDTDITDLVAKDVTHTNQITALVAKDVTHTNQITALVAKDVTHKNQPTALVAKDVDLQTKITANDDEINEIRTLDIPDLQTQITNLGTSSGDYLERMATYYQPEYE